MSYTDVVSRISTIQAHIASLQTAFDPSATGTSATQSTTGTAAAGSSGSFASALAQARRLAVG